MFHDYFFLQSFSNGTNAKIATKVIDIVPNIVNAISNIIQINKEIKAKIATAEIATVPNIINTVSAIIQSLNIQTTAKIVIPTITILAIAKPISNINIIQNSYIFLIVNCICHNHIIYITNIWF